MIRLRLCFCAVVVGMLAELLAIYLFWRFKTVWICVATALLGCALCAGGLTVLYRLYRYTGRCVDEATRRNATSVDEECLFSSEINALLKKYNDSVYNVNLETAIRSTQLQALMEQINPHFLYNTLESIRGQALFSGDEIVAEMAETLSMFFRYCISRKGALVRLKDEIANVNIYLKIMEFRYPNKFGFKIIGDIPSVLNYEMPKLTLQPIVENSILHGIMDYIGRGEITLRIVDTDDSLKIYVRDNGVGISDEQVRIINDRLLNDSELSAATKMDKSGIALYNINRRIKLSYGAEYGLRIFSTEQTGTNVVIHIPKKQLESERR